jgi:diguanylate cyclase (GGDEF)-like protein/PAS domain S-box-containing protein
LPDEPIQTTLLTPTAGRLSFFCGAVAVLCLLPLGLMAAGVDFSSGGPSISKLLSQGLTADGSADAVHHALRGSFTHTILEWTAVCIAAVVCALALIQYRLVRDPSLPIIGVALASAGAMDAFHTLAADRLIHAVADNKDLIPFTWAICRLFNGTIQLIGVGIVLLWAGRKARRSTAWTAGISLGFIVSAYLIVDYCATSSSLPRTMFPGQMISRPYDLYPLAPFLLCGLVVFPLYYRRNPSLFGAALILSMIPQVATQLYMAFGSAALHDSAFNVAHSLKAVAYLFPAVGLLAENMNAFRRHQVAESALRNNQQMMEGVLSELEDQRLALDEHAIVSIADIRGDILYANDKFCQLSGYTLEELVGQNHRVVKSDEHDHAFYRDLWKTVAGGNIWRGEIKNQAKDGTHYWVDATIVPFKDEHGKITQYVAVRTDITAMKESERRFKLAVNGSRDGLWDWDLLTDRVYYAPQWKRMLGLGPEDKVGDSPEEWITRIDQRDTGTFMQEFDEHLSGEDETFEVELRMIHKLGHTVWMLCRGSVVRDKTGRAVRVAGSMADITAIKEAQEKLRKAAEHDRLTDLANRELFQKRLQQAIHRAVVEPDFKFAVLFFDFDRFKVINDSLGHNVGDALLIDIARQFESILRRGDTPARFGGDEFVVLLNHLEDYHEARLTADRLLETFARPHNLLGHEVTSTASIGLVTSAQGYASAQDMLRDADAAMYQAKEAGKARVVVFDQAMHRQAMDRLQLEADLRLALERGEFHLLYQPIVSLEAGELQGFEALLRWDHPTRGVVSPEQFIPIAEDTGLIVPIGQWILSEACRQLHRWNSTDRPELPVSLNVNLSMRQVCHPGVVEMIQRAITDSSIDPGYLKLEVTESTIVDDRHDMIPLLNQIKELGIQLAMDDFGTGHSSLSNLHKLPVDVLKIDQSFIKSMSANRELAAVMHAIITVAQHLGMTTVAEGIETPEQLVMLQSLDCNLGQGYYFKKPMPADDATRYLLGFDDSAASA